jgi:glycosyltransferase involved in cell wall biosynthesis
MNRQRYIINEHGLGLWRKWYHILAIRISSIFSYGVINSCNAVARVRRTREKIHAEKLVTIYNSYDGDERVVRQNSIIPSEIGGNRVTLGFVGRFSSVKRTQIFIEIARQLRERSADFEIIMIGDG